MSNSTDNARWSVWKRKCHYNYRDGCSPVWVASPPGEDDEWSWEFDTWREAMNFVASQVA